MGLMCFVVLSNQSQLLSVYGFHSNVIMDTTFVTIATDSKSIVSNNTKNVVLTNEDDNNKKMKKKNKKTKKE